MILIPAEVLVVCILLIRAEVKPSQCRQDWRRYTVPASKTDIWCCLCSVTALFYQLLMKSQFCFAKGNISLGYGVCVILDNRFHPEEGEKRGYNKGCVLVSDVLCTPHISRWWLWSNQVCTASKRCLCLCTCVCFMVEKLQDMPLSRPTETHTHVEKIATC